MQFYTMSLLLVVGLLLSLTNVETLAVTTTANSTAIPPTTTHGNGTAAPKSSAVSLYAVSFMNVIPLLLGYRLLN